MAALTSWSRKKLRNIFTRADEIELEISNLQEKECSPLGLSQEEVIILQNLVATRSNLLCQQECYWRQRSRVCWLGQGDSNTKFFYSTASSRRKGNWICSLEDPTGVVKTDLNDIQELFISHFMKYWGHNSEMAEEMPILPGPSFSSEEANEDTFRGSENSTSDRSRSGTPSTDSCSWRIGSIRANSVTSTLVPSVGEEGDHIVYAFIATKHHS